MKFLDLNKENAVITKDLFKAVIDKGEYLLGSYLQKLEDIFPKSVGYDYGVTFKNATDALSVLIGVLLKDKKKVICPNFTAYPTAVAIRSKTKQVYYVDVDESLTCNIDDFPRIKNAIVVVVNLFGNNGDLDKIRKWCDATNSIMIEDCAQSTGSESKARVSDFAVYSFYPTKPLGSMGDGGMICFNDLKWKEYFKIIRFYGQTKEEARYIGINSRMDEWQCAIVLEKMKHYRKWNDKRIKIAERYKQHIKGISVHSQNVYHRFPVLYNKREEVVKKTDFPFMVQYDKHITDMGVLKGKRNKVNFRVNDKILILPLHSMMKESEICQIEEFLYKTKNYEY